VQAIGSGLRRHEVVGPRQNSKREVGSSDQVLKAYLGSYLQSRRFIISVLTDSGDREALGCVGCIGCIGCIWGGIITGR